MALPASQLHLAYPSTRFRFTSAHFNHVSNTFQLFTKHPLKITQLSFKPHKFSTILRASQEEENKTSTTNEDNNEPTPPAEIQNEISQRDLGMEIKKAMKERGEKESGNLFSGVAEEIREIEWPGFSKVLATTGVVLGVIAGSSVVLLTVNAVLAEISDGVFAGKGVQDFFG